MAIFSFQLANPRIYLNAEGDSDEWSMSFDAIIKRSSESFEVICDGERYDGWNLAGEVRIDPHPSQNRPVAASERAELRTKLGYILIRRNNPPSFLIFTSLSPNAFFHLLQANLENCHSSLFIETISMRDKDLQEVRGDEGLYMPSDGPLLYEWDTAKKWTACLNRVELTITPRSEEASVSGPSQKVIPQAPPSPIPGAADTLDLIRAVNRLWWAVVIIGLLVVLMAS